MQLREIEDEDLPVYWEHLSDPAVQQMAAITRGYHYDRAAFDRHWAKVRSDPTVLHRTIVADGEVAGHVAAFGPADEREITYIVGRSHWGRGIATSALRALLELERTRPLHAYTAADNGGSLRVLAKCGFTVGDRVRDFARARGHEIELVHLTLT